jgi:hypothetical protein
MSYDVTGQINQQVRIGPASVVNILDKEIATILGGKEYYITNGVIQHDYKYHTWQTDIIRDATPEEIEIYDALMIARQYFNSKPTLQL